MDNMDQDGPQNVVNISNGHQKCTNTLGSVKSVNLSWTKPEKRKLCITKQLEKE